MKKHYFTSALFSLFLLVSCQGTGLSTPQSENTSESTTATTEYSTVDTTTSENTTVEETTKEDSTTANSEKDSESNSATDSQVEQEDIELLSYWNTLDLNLYGQNMLDALVPLINATGHKTIGYSQNNNVLTYSDSIDNKGEKVIPFYHGPNDAVASTVGSGSINKEHVWPNSRGVGKSGPGADPHMLRPALSNENSDRGNNFYGLAGAKTFDPASLGYEPARGECARIIFYTCARYQKSNNLSLSNNPNDLSSENTMGRLDLLIAWNNTYPVTQQEKNRNEYLYKEGFGRNPFIDHPQLANYIWDSNDIRTSSYQGGGSSETEGNVYNRIASVDKLVDGSKVAIVSNYQDVSTSYAALNDTAISQNLPWYLSSTAVENPQNNEINTHNNLCLFNVKKEGDYYTFSTDKGYLFHYHTDHYSIGIGNTPTDNGSIKWKVSINNGKAVLLGEQDVYLVLSDQSHATWKGYSSDPSADLGLYTLQA